MAKMETLHHAVVLSTKKEIDAVILRRYVDNQDFLDSKEKSMKYVTQRDKKESADPQKNFNEN